MEIKYSYDKQHQYIMFKIDLIVWKSVPATKKIDVKKSLK